MMMTARHQKTNVYTSAVYFFSILSQHCFISSSSGDLYYTYYKMDIVHYNSH